MTAADGSHLHFFFDTVPVGQAGGLGGGLWTEYEGPARLPRSAERAARQRWPAVRGGGECRSHRAARQRYVQRSAQRGDCPGTGGYRCLSGAAVAFPPTAQLRAGQVAVVLGLSPDEAWWNVADPETPDDTCWLPVQATRVSGDISKVPVVEGPPLPTGAAPDNLSVEIRRISLDDQGRYVVEFRTAGFAAQLPGTHIHFFFDSVPPEQVGMSGEGLRLMHGGPSPFTGYAAADRPAEAGECAPWWPIRITRWCRAAVTVRCCPTHHNSAQVKKRECRTGKGKVSTWRTVMASLL